MTEKVKVVQHTYQTVEITPQLLANAFFQMDDTEQREFFEELAKVWKDSDFDNQMFHIVSNGEMSWEAVEILKTIGSHALPL